MFIQDKELDKEFDKELDKELDRELDKELDKELDRELDRKNSSFNDAILKKRKLTCDISSNSCNNNNFKSMNSFKYANENNINNTHIGGKSMYLYRYVLIAIYLYHYLITLTLVVCLSIYLSIYRDFDYSSYDTNDSME
jgi:hypothetical protein